ncbi:hypothetical protein GCM10010360_16380 [Streptomyces nogalater]
MVGDLHLGLAVPRLREARKGHNAKTSRLASAHRCKGRLRQHAPRPKATLWWSQGASHSDACHSSFQKEFTVLGYFSTILEVFNPRYLLTVLRFLPVLIIVVLMAPAFLTWPFLPQRRHDSLLEFMQKLIDWTRATRN